MIIATASCDTEKSPRLIKLGAFLLPGTTPLDLAVDVFAGLVEDVPFQGLVVRLCVCVGIAIIVS